MPKLATRDLPTIQPPCAVCVGRSGPERTPWHLTHGVVVWLCAAHRENRFLARRGGREFTERLAARWAAAGCLTVTRARALRTHIGQVAAAATRQPTPGSYSWPELRQEAERRFDHGEPPGDVIRELRQRYRHAVAQVPSTRTMRRWFSEARWRQPSLEPPSPVRMSAAKAHRYGAHCLDIILEHLDALPRADVMLALNAWYVPPHRRRGRRQHWG